MPLYRVKSQLYADAEALLQVQSSRICFAPFSWDSASE